MTKEHNFNVTAGEWEKSVFEAAVLEGHFVVYDGATKERVEFRTFPDAVRWANLFQRALVYAVAKSGRHTVIPRNMWNEYAELYLTIEGRQ